jgi:RNA polymerase sigma-32 factor
MHHPNLDFRVNKLSLEEEHELFKKAQSGDRRAYDSLIVNNMHIARMIASKYRFYGVPVEDLFQEACIGMMQAVKTFDPGYGIKFSSHASIFMKEKVLSHVVANFRSVKFGTTKKKIKLFFNYGKLAREGYTHKQIADLLGVDVLDVDMAARYLSSQDIDITEEAENEEGRLILKYDVFASDDDVLENVIDLRGENDLYSKISEVLKLLPERKQKIITERWLNEEKKTLQEIGEELGVSTERVRQLEVEAMKFLREG